MFKLYSQICSIQYHYYSSNSSCSKIDPGLTDLMWQARFMSQCDTEGSTTTILYEENIQ